MNTETRKTIWILENQLRNGTKPRKNGVPFKSYDPKEIILNEKGKPRAIKLNTKDVARIKKEIKILASKTS